MSQHYETPRRDCRKCTGYTFPNGCANFCDLFELEAEDDDFDFDPSESRGEIICDNCLSATSGHCPGQLDCDKWHGWTGNGSKPFDPIDIEPRTIGFHLLDSETN